MQQYVMRHNWQLEFLINRLALSKLKWQEPSDLTARCSIVTFKIRCFFGIIPILIDLPSVYMPQFPTISPDGDLVNMEKLHFAEIRGY